MRSALVFTTCLCLLLMACNPDKNKVVDQTTISFKTNDATKLFFKNVRQTYYDLEEMEAAKLDIYRLKKRTEEAARPLINLAIVNNWRYDEAYLLLEPNDQLSLANLNLQWKNVESGETGEIKFKNGNKETIVEFADQVYLQIQQGSEFLVEISGELKEFLSAPEDREAFRITMFDYYRLVQRL